MPSAELQPSNQQHHSIIVATAGHVDHGKTSLVRALTGIDTDTLLEEKQRGLTINLGFAYAKEKLTDSDETCVLGFVDVPGHKDFIHNMLAGVGSIQVALLAIAADDGVMPQTIEHLQILDLLDIRHGVIAITKSDRCDEKRINNLQQEVRELLKPTSLASAPILITSSKSASGIEQLKSQLLTFAAQTRTEQEDTQHFRFQVDRSFTVKGIGTVVTGTALAGRCQQGDSLRLSANKKDARVRSIRLHETEIANVCAGERAALNLAGIDPHEIKRGDWLHDSQLEQSLFRFDAKMHWLAEQAPRSGVQYHLHIGAAHRMATVRTLGEANGNWFQIRAQEGVAVHFGDRFIVRDATGTRTVGGGYVVDVHVPRRHRSDAERLAKLAAMDHSHQEAFCKLLELATTGIVLSQFQRNRNLTEQGMQQLISHVKTVGVQVISLESRSLGNVVFSRALFEGLSKSLLHCVREFHTQHPSQSGIAEPQLSKAMKFAGSFSLLQAVVEKLIELSLLMRTGNQLHLADHTPKISPEEKYFESKILPLLRTADIVPPRTRELAESLELPLNKLLSTLKVLERNGLLVRVAENRYYLPDTLLKLAALVETLVQENPADEGLSVIQFRDRSGIGRNLCIEILEYFDRRGFTRRDGNTRFVRTDKENIFS